MKNFICLVLIDSFDPRRSCQIDVILSYVPILAKRNEVDRSPIEHLSIIETWRFLKHILSSTLSRATARLCMLRIIICK